MLQHISGRTDMDRITLIGLDGYSKARFLQYYLMYFGFLLKKTKIAVCE